MTLNPLVCRSAAVKHLELSARARGSERFHYEVMRRAAPELVPLPFYQDGWAPEIVASSPVPIPPRPMPRRRPSSWRRAAARLAKPVRRQPTPTIAAPRSTNPGWAFLDDERGAIIALFRDAERRTNMASICDLDTMITFARTSEPIRQLGTARQMTNAIGVALALLNIT